MLSGANASKISDLQEAQMGAYFPKVSKCLSGVGLYFFHNARRCPFLSRHSSQLCPRSSVRVLPSGCPCVSFSSLGYSRPKIFVSMTKRDIWHRIHLIFVPAKKFQPV